MTPVPGTPAVPSLAPVLLRRALAGAAVLVLLLLAGIALASL